MQNVFTRILNSLFINMILYIIIPTRKKCIITCNGKTDGMGAQVLAIYSAILYSKIFNLKYLHTPIKSVEHNYDNDHNFANKIEDFFSFSKNEHVISEIPSKHTIIDIDSFTLNTFRLVLSYLFTRNSTIIFKKSHYHNYTNNHVDKYNLIKEELKRKYYTNYKQKNNNKTNSSEKTIVIHIRRGDVGINDKERYTDNLEIKSKILQCKTYLEKENLNPIFKIYSQGNENDFKDFKGIASFNLNGNIFDDFNDMVQADILFTAKSAMSYSAALLSDGKIIYEKFWHKPLNNWIIYNSDKNYYKKLTQK